jgi:glutathione S-transferase
MMQLTLVYAPVSCALVPYLTLTEAGASFDVRAIDHNRGLHLTPDALAVNPKGKIPVLLIDGKPLTENVAIQLWIARRFPEAGLLPDDPDDYVAAIELMAWFASAIHQHLTPINRPQRYCDLPGTEDRVKQLAAELLFGDFAIVEQRLAGRQWFFESFTAVDAYFFWCFRRAKLFGLDLDRFANCRGHFERVAQRPSAVQALAFEKQVLDSFALQH